MKQIITSSLLVSLALFFTGCAKPQVASAPNHQISFAGKRIVFIGDSITAGTVAEPQRWVNLLASSKGASLLNLGISGQVLQNGTGCGGAHFPIFDNTSIPTYTDSDAALFIALGTNDIGVNNGSMTSEEFKATLASTVAYAVEQRGWPVRNIVLLTPYKTTDSGKALYSNLHVCSIGAPADEARAYAYALATASVAQSTGAVLADIYSAMIPADLSVLIGGDGIHPTEAGNAFIADYLSSLDL